MIRFYFLSFFACLFALSCSNDKLPEQMIDCLEEYTYQSHVKAIIDNSCAYVGCHASGNPSGDYTSYQSLVPFIENDKFTDRVLSEKNMPPIYAPDDRPKSLTEAELNILSCWIENGFPN